MKKLILLLCIIAILCPIAFSELTDDLYSYYSLEEESGSEAVDEIGNRNATITNTDFYPNGKINRGYAFNGASAYLDFKDNGGFFDVSRPEGSIAFWFNSNQTINSGNTQDDKFIDIAGGSNRYFRIGFSSATGSSDSHIYGLFRNAEASTPTEYLKSTTDTWNQGQWYYIVATWDSAGAELYVNGVEENSTTWDTGYTQADASGAKIGSQFNGFGSFWYGLMDEVAFWNRSITPAEVEDLYNSGNGLPYPLTGKFYIQSTEYNGVRLQNYTATIRNTTDGSIIDTYTTTTGVIMTDINADAGNLNVTILDNQTNANYILDGHITNPLYLLELNYSVLNITANNEQTASQIDTFNATTINAYNYATNGNAYILRNPSTSIVFVDSTGFVKGNSTTTATEGVQDISVDLFPINTIKVTVYNGTDGSLVTGDTVTVSIFGDVALTNTTTTGEVYFTNLTAGTYTVQVEHSGSEDSIYSATLANASHQSIDAYLFPDTSESVTLTIYNEQTGQVIEGATVSISTTVNGTLTVISVQSTDVTGRISFNYQQGDYYTFTITEEGYTLKTFSLTPIIFASYSILLIPSITADDENDYSGISLSVSPRSFSNNKTYNVIMDIADPQGRLTLYNISIATTINGTTYYSQGNNAYGSILNTPVHINGASIGDYVTVTYQYKTSDNDTRVFRFTSTINQITNDNKGTSIWAGTNPYGLALFDRVFIVTVVSIIVAGVGFLFGGTVLGGLLLMLTLGYFIFINILPTFVLAIGIVAIFFLTAWRSQQ